MQTAQKLEFLLVFFKRRPLDLVLLVLLYQTYSFQNIGDIVDAAFLDLQVVHCIVKVNTLAFGSFYKIYELLGQLDQPVLLPGSLACRGERLVVYRVLSTQVREVFRGLSVFLL